MTARTRKFLLGSSALLVAGLCTGLVAYFGGLPTGAFSGPGAPPELAYVPSDAAVVAFADVREVMNSELRQKLQGALPPEDKGREEFKNQTGIDIETDIDRVVACMMPQEGHKSGFVVLRGRFDQVRLEALAREHNAIIEGYKGLRMVRMPEGETTAEAEQRQHVTPALVFVEPGLLMAGDVTALRAAIDAHAAGQAVTANPELMKLIGDVDGTANVWAVGRFDILASRANLPEGVVARLPAVKYFTAAGHINGGLDGVLRAEARDEESAKNLRDVLNGFMALGRMQASSKPELQALMNSVTLGGTGSTVELGFRVPSEMIDVLQQLKGASAPPVQH